jgi:hypothetical protein
MTRITADTDSRDFWRWAFKSSPVVRLDGVEVREVHSADDVVGYVEHYVRPFTICHCGERLILALSFGKVSFEGEHR